MKIIIYFLLNLYIFFKKKFFLFIFHWMIDFNNISTCLVLFYAQRWGELDLLYIYIYIFFM